MRAPKGGPTAESKAFLAAVEVKKIGGADITLASKIVVSHVRAAW